MIIGFEKNDNNIFEQDTISLNSGDRIFLYTDGIIEAENDQRKALGIDGLIQIIDDLKDQPVSALVDSVIEVIRQKSYTQVRDDIFLIAADIL